MLGAMVDPDITKSGSLKFRAIEYSGRHGGHQDSPWTSPWQARNTAEHEGTHDVTVNLHGQVQTSKVVSEGAVIKVQFDPVLFPENSQDQQGPRSG